jgi:hypothetical protein
MEGARAVVRGRRIRIRPAIVVPLVAVVAIAAAALIAVPKLTDDSGSGSSSATLA